MIAYTDYHNLEDFPAWSVGKETLDILIEKGVCREVEKLINSVYKDQPKDIYDIYSFLTEGRDEIAQYLGYEDWDAFENGEETYKDINGVELAVSDEVHWHDEAGRDEDGSMITFTIVEESYDGYFNLSYGDEDDYPDRWAYYTELEIV